MISYDKFVRDYQGKGVKTIKIEDQAFRRYSEAIMIWLRDLNLTVPREDEQLHVETLYAYPMKANALKGAPCHLPEGQQIKNLEN